MSISSYLGSLGRSGRGGAGADLPVREITATAPSAVFDAVAVVSCDFPEDDIEFREGRYYVGGYGFLNWDQAAQFAWRIAKGRTVALAPPSRLVPVSSEWLPVSHFRASDVARAGSEARPLTPPPASSPQHARFSRADLPQAQTIGGQERWIGSPTLVRVADISFVAELVHAGLPKGRYSYPSNNALIDPTLSVAGVGDPHGATLNYWPRYADLDSRARRSYLEWLADGRRDPRTPIGYVFLFFYGLEWRLVYEKDREDADVILAEVRRLLTVYGDNHSFRRYATALLEFGDVILDTPPWPLIPSLDRLQSYEMPVGIRLALGACLADQRPLDADQTLCWLLALPDTYLRTPAKRCFDELIALWRLRFGEAYPEGLKVRAPKAKISIQYRAAQGGFNADATVDVPDIARVMGPIPRLRTLLMSCSDELDAFSRFLGKSPGANQTMEAAILLPRALRQSAPGEAIRACLARFDQIFGGEQRAVLPVAQLAELVEIGVAPAFSSASSRHIANMLDALDIGFEPDKRYGTCGSIMPDTQVCIFRAEAGGAVAPDAERYLAARALTEIAAIAATADGVVAPVEVEAIQRDLASLNLSEVEQARLLAHAEAILLNPPKAKAAIKRLLALPEDQRRRIRQSALSVILADGRILPSEVRFLEGLYKALGFPNEDIYAELHRGSVEIDEPVKVAEAVAEAGVALPAEEDEGSVTVDFARLERIRKETSQVSSLLATIFVDDADVQLGSAPPARAAEASRFAGLDAAHADLLAILIIAPMERPEFEEAARARRLLPDGALETINDWSFDQFDEPAVEEEDMILIAAHLLDPIRTLEKVTQ